MTQLDELVKELNIDPDQGVEEALKLNGELIIGGRLVVYEPPAKHKASTALADEPAPDQEKVGE